MFVPDCPAKPTTNDNSTSSWTSYLLCILTYKGNVRDVVLNYSLTIIHFIYCLYFVKCHITSAYRTKFAWVSLICVSIFQISLCLCLGCSGISIIWCSMAGWIMSERSQLRKKAQQDYEQHSATNEEPQRRRQQQQHESPLAKRLEQVEPWIILVDVIVIVVIYGIMKQILPPIIAHVLSLILGSMLSMISIKIEEESFSSEGANEAMADASTPLLPTEEQERDEQ